LLSAIEIDVSSSEESNIETRLFLILLSFFVFILVSLTKIDEIIEYLIYKKMQI